MTAVHPQLPQQDPFNGFSAHIGLVLHEYSQAQTIIGFTVQAHHLNRAGNLHGGVIASLADSAMGMSGTWHAVPAQRRLALTLSLNIIYMAAAAPGPRSEPWHGPGAVAPRSLWQPATCSTSKGNYSRAQKGFSSAGAWRRMATEAVARRACRQAQYKRLPRTCETGFRQGIGDVNSSGSALPFFS
ncbi:PaaI family thioesterase [Pseudomonas sp. TH05]|uniref:PaaI family thioesterase n=1 Tax=Pseudomonas sp. TH05 TaxID=2796371 RepID=UPI001F5BAFF7|nr:PaaI family thioesterase [Pseudomonas sp. TH05]